MTFIGDERYTVKVKSLNKISPIQLFCCEQKDVLLKGDLKRKFVFMQMDSTFE